MTHRKSVALLAGFAMAILPSVSHANDSLITKGKYLATAGDCQACHTAAGGEPFAGGRPIETPFGVIYSTNITPDKTTGIGGWTEQQFYRAMHSGIAANGTHLYPAMPYPYYTRVSHEDVDAIKAYLFSLAPVTAPAKPNALPFPFNFRTGMVAWNAVSFQPGAFRPDPAHSPEFNRGAYLVQGLGHCGACHTPRNLAGAGKSGEALAGGAVQDWYAPNITSNPREGIGAWSKADLVTFLKTGAAPGKGVVLGPMAETIHDSLSRLTDADLDAITEYLKSAPPQKSYPPTRPVAGPSQTGAEIYLSNCAFCHQTNGRGVPHAVPSLAGNGAVRAGGPQDIIRIVLGGHFAEPGYTLMPAIGTGMTDAEIAKVTNFIRAAWGNNAPQNAGPGMVGAIRAKTHTWLSEPAASCTATPSPAPSVSAVIADPANGIEPLLQGLKATAEAKQVSDLVARLHKSAPRATTAAIVNGLTYAYCPIATQGATPEQARQSIERFAQVAFTAATSLPR